MRRCDRGCNGVGSHGGDSICNGSHIAGSGSGDNCCDANNSI